MAAQRKPNELLGITERSLITLPAKKARPSGGTSVRCPLDPWPCLITSDSEPANRPLLAGQVVFSFDPTRIRIRPASSEMVPHQEEGVECSDPSPRAIPLTR